jgi:hypothetical protein
MENSLDMIVLYVILLFFQAMSICFCFVLFLPADWNYGSGVVEIGNTCQGSYQKCPAR